MKHVSGQVNMILLHHSQIRNLVMKLQQLETQEGERHCEEHLKQVKQNFF